jgi:S-adenosylmethionine/arginine decarboxylase-like enzyme
MAWGVECLIDAQNCDKESIRDLSNIQAFIDELCLVTKMNKWGPLHSMYLGSSEYNNSKDITGWSVCQFITTSSIVMHFCDNSGNLYLDFFSCKTFNEHDVTDLVIKYFKAKAMSRRMITRDA